MRNQTPLSDEQIQTLAPSVFAGQAHDSRSDRYAFVSTSAIIDGMRANGFEPVFASQSRTRVAGKQFFTKHQIRFQNPTQTALNLGDVITQFILTGSHDGTSCYILNLGAMRLACLNGMMVPDSLSESVRVRHVGDAVNLVINGTNELMKRAGVVIEAVQTWKQIILTDAESLILAEESLALRFDVPTVDASRLLQARRSADLSNDLWTVFNRIQENTVRGGLRYQAPVVDEAGQDTGNTRRARTREVKGIDQSNKLNQALWSLAAKMAELKQNS
jgi:hypothetical protein